MSIGLYSDPDVARGFIQVNGENKMEVGQQYAKLPSGTTEQRPSSPTAGMMRFNTETGRHERYTGTAWRDVISDLANEAQVTFADGSASAPSIANTGDTNSGIFFPADNAVALTSNGTERLRVDSSGNVSVTGSLLENSIPVVIQTDIGTDPNQIPLNSYLGSAAYVDVQTSMLDRTPGRIVTTEYVDFVMGSRFNDIGVAGGPGFGVGIYPGMLPTGFSTMTTTNVKNGDDYGNYQYSDGSIMCWVPKFYYRIGSPSSPNYGIYGLNAIDIASIYDFPDETTANNSGYALHRAFKNGGATKNGFFADKYLCSNNSGKASSLKNGNPLSSNSAHNPFSGLTGAPANTYYGAIDAAKTRGASFHCMSRFQFAALALLATAHGQAATGATWCGWYDSTLAKNYPKGNNNLLVDVDDTSVTFVSDGYSSPASSKTGSASYPAKVAHNGQLSGIMDLNGNMWEINLGMTRPGANATDTAQQNDAAAFYVLKESVDVNALTSGWSNVASGNEAFGDAVHLATLYDAITLSHIGSGTGWEKFGSGTNQVLDPATSGDGYRQTGLGIYTATGHGATGINLFGVDGVYEYHRANLCLVSGGDWSSTSGAGVWALGLNHYRTNSGHHVGFRSAAYL